MFVKQTNNGYSKISVFSNSLRYFVQLVVVVVVLGQESSVQRTSKVPSRKFGSASLVFQNKTQIFSNSCSKLWREYAAELRINLTFQICVAFVTIACSVRLPVELVAVSDVGRFATGTLSEGFEETRVQRSRVLCFILH